MKEVKLTDFTKAELQTMLDALAVYEAHLKANRKRNPKERERIQLLVTQVINAKVEVRMRERVTLN